MDAAQHTQPATSRWRFAERVYAFGLFVAAVAVLSTVSLTGGMLPGPSASPAAAFFLVYGVFTIAIGYEHPKLGYYSFDRVSQVASILVLGPIDAAWVNGLASLVYPLHRLLKGVPARDVLFASLNNAGLMALIVFTSGSLYVVAGGGVPLISMDGSDALLVIGLVLTMQILNDLGMLGMLLVGRRDIRGFFQPFFVALELGSGAAAVLVALVYNSMSTAVLLLLLGVLSLGMLALRQFANMRLQLELLVAARTRSLQEKTRELELQATQDNLTGLYNRRYAEEYLERQLAHAQRYGQSFSVALADIDLFKQINDAHSHAIGDEVLRTVADTLRARCRKTDMISRYGGEEFLIGFPETGREHAEALCEALRAAIEDADWASLGLRDTVTISFGVAQWSAKLTASSLVHTADLRLYAAKEAGRNLVVASSS